MNPAGRQKELPFEDRENVDRQENRSVSRAPHYATDELQAALDREDRRQRRQRKIRGALAAAAWLIVIGVVIYFLLKRSGLY
jgi:hypothetical protein